MHICEQICLERRAGKTIFGIYRGKQILTRKERFRILHLDDPSEWESELEFNEAISYLEQAISIHLYSNRELMSKEGAKKYALAFLKSVPEDSKFYTNCYYGNSPEPLSNSYIDTGIYCVKNNGIAGILWVLDELER
ncbi:hypothetical protein [Celerinatantimonas sp. MCCC 1A17872]|uniref:hypothetical protein n=1 Tax=Celerinatantimonas sp. MCCC 1A17872 TaxID=3177514 RepID=UPI0038BF0E5F